MVKADVKHNYYADLDLTNTCSIEDIKKQYRKLALIYHPDRNAGKEEEYVPRFQAIQTAHEILGDATTKAKYDADRRKAGLYPTGPTFRANQPAPGNPYSANTNYPPPPRRTQPGSWQRPQQPSASTPTGADRFTNFPRGAAPTARKDPAQDRTNMFRAWQNMNNAQERQQQFNPGAAQPAAAAPSPGRPVPPRPRPPPRPDTQYPGEDEIRAGMNYRQPPPPGFGFEGQAERGQSAWADSQQKTAGKPSVSRSNTSKTPKKAGGFDPNVPGSDERPAGDGGYSRRHQSEDFGRSQPGKQFPPPPPGPPPLSPLSPGASPSGRRPFANPTRPFNSRTMDEEVSQVPYSEGNRKSTPYSSFIGEKTHVSRESGDGLRRSASTHDTTTPGGGSGGTGGRARSTSPLGRQHYTAQGQQQNDTRKPFVDYSDSDASDERPVSSTPEGYDSATTTPADADHPSGTTQHSSKPHQRPKKIPNPPSTRFGGSAHPFGPPPTDGAQSDTELPGMQQKNSNNMYVNRDSFQRGTFSPSPFSPDQWASQAFGTPSASSNVRKPSIPKWAFPSSVLPVKPKGQPAPPQADTWMPEPRDYTLGEDFANATPDQQAAYSYYCHQEEQAYGEPPEDMNMRVFLQTAQAAVQGKTSGRPFLDKTISQTFKLWPSVAKSAVAANNSHATSTDSPLGTDSFTYPSSSGATFTPTAKSRSEEHINTKFSPDGWSGTFQGSSDYFAPPQSPIGKKPGSPFRRQKSGLRSATTHVHTSGTSTDSSDMPPPPRPFGADGQQQAEGASTEVKFSTEEWKKTFKDSSWTWPPPPPKPPSPSKGVSKARTPSRKASKARSGTRDQSHSVEDGTTENGGNNNGQDSQVPTADDGDAMDIDSTPPAPDTEPTSESTPKAAANGKEPRLYSVPPSTWRQQQQQTQTNGHARSPSSRTSAEGGFHTNLDDLAHVEPLAPGANGLKNFGDLGSTLPFPSQAAAHPVEPQKLHIPPVPKAPEPPHQLSKHSWHLYAQTFGAYLKAYHGFNKTMVKHFEAREEQTRVRLMVGTSWLEAIGDTSGTTAGGPSGFGSYLQGVREDEAVRETWSIGCERHMEACKGFEKVRERVKRLTAGGGLVDH